MSFSWRFDLASHTLFIAMLDGNLRTLVEKHGVTGLLHHQVLIVDDDEPNLDVLEAVLEGDYKVHKATSGREALEIVNLIPLDVIISDQRMAEMTGVELLELVKKSHPDIAGIVLTAYTDSPAIMSAINRAQVFRFLTKPWQPHEILAAVEQASINVEQHRAIKRLVEIVSARNEELAATLEELRSTQQQLLHMERLSTIGRLTSGVTHDLRNFLSGLALIEEDIATREVPSDLRDTVTTGLAGVRNLLATLETMNQFASSGKLGIQPRPTDPKSIVKDATTVLRLDMEFRRRNVNVRIAEGLPTITVDHQKMVQVLVNLVRNAVQATRQGQMVLIEAVLSPGGGVVFAVEDEGPGIPEDLKDRLFDPFVTTKGSAGMGIGLYMAKLVVESHGGQIRCADRPLGGARFEVVFERTGGVQ